MSTATALAVGFSGTAVVTAAPTQNTDVCTNSLESLKAMQRWSAATKAVKRAEGDKVVAATYAEMLAEAQQDLQVKTAEAAEKRLSLIVYKVLSTFVELIRKSAMLSKSC
ncbi:hypothetical protein [Corynebacterium diphtheriae]|uniref:hypothetical protein n=1 Tax=Corynebacterium diphtheriae TaxID=1717 RepID=UPI0020179123|nr:hypothetical protein [Corynebacterium diphtheriae]